MNKFDTVIFNKLKESVVSLSKFDLDPGVFNSKENGSPVLRDSIKVQILKDIDQIRNVAAVVRFYMVGSILTTNYDNSSDIDVTVEIDSHSIDNISTATLMHTIKNLNGKLASDTLHPINYYIITHELNDDKYDAVYDIINDKWLKIPKKYEPDVEKWNIKFHDTLKSIDIATGELRRDLIDLDEIRNLDIKNIKKLKFLMSQKLDQIEEVLKDLVNTYKNTRLLRQMAFDRFLTPQEIQIFGSYNRLPENIVYKLLEKYYYIKFIQKIKEILDEKDGFDLTDVPQIKKAMGDIWKNS